MLRTSGLSATRRHDYGPIVRALIAGLGAIGQRHARNLRALNPEIELLAYRQRGRAGTISSALEHDPERDPTVALGAKSCTDLDAALAERPDIVMVCTPSSQHLEIALRAAEAGCHIYIEKPVSTTLNGLARLAASVKTGGLVVAVGCQWRFHPCVEVLHQTIRSGELGAIRRATITFSEYLPGWHPYEDYRESYAARFDLGGGVVLSQIHDYDLAHWLLGTAGTVVASATSGGPLGVDVEHSVRAQFDAGGAQVFVRQTFAEPDRVRTMEVIGATGEARVELVEGTLQFSGTPELVAKSVAVREYDRNEMFTACLRDFLACVANGGSPRTPLADGIAVLRLALAVKESARRGVPVTVG